jgi:hypothetical protein
MATRNGKTLRNNILCSKYKEFYIVQSQEQKTSLLKFTQFLGQTGFLLSFSLN